MSVAIKLLERLGRRPKQLDLEAYLLKLKEKGLTPHGEEVSDPVPIAPPIGYKKHPSMVEIVRDMVQSERLRVAALEAGSETFEESEDFDVGDEPELRVSGYENDLDPGLNELLTAGQQEVDRKAREAVSPASPTPPPSPAQNPPSDGPKPNPPPSE